MSFEIPFEMFVVFATNLPLSDICNRLPLVELAEDAFMRRLKNKIKIEPLSPDFFVELLRRVCKDEKLPCSPRMKNYVSRECLKQSPEGLPSECFPTDLIKDTIRGIATFEKRTPSLNKDDVDKAVRVYFVH